MKITDLKNDALVGVYIELRDRRAQRKAAFDNDDAGDKAKQEKIENVLLARLNEDGSESVRTTMGTVYKYARTSCTVADWSSFFEQFVLPEQNWEFLERRVSKAAVEAYKTEKGDIPPGLNWREETMVGVRRA